VQRHQTLRAAIDWSYQLCSEGERRLFARLAVFVGGCTAEAAEHVCGTDPLWGAATFETLTSLVAKSLVVAQHPGPTTRYRLLETIREYGEDRLTECDETDQLRRRHAEYYCQLAADIGDRLGGSEQLVAGRRMAAEQDNLLAAFNFAVATADVDLALRLVRHTPPPPEQLGFSLWLPISVVLNLPAAAHHGLYPYALASSANLAARRGQLQHVEGACQQALQAAHRLGSQQERRQVEFMVAIARGDRFGALGQWKEAAGYWELAARIARENGMAASGAQLLAAAAFAYTMAGTPQAGGYIAEEALEMARAAGAPTTVATALVALAGTVAETDPLRARGLLEEALTVRDSPDIENLIQLFVATLIAAHMRDWTLTLQLADRAIRHLQWGGEQPSLAGVLNLVARVLAPTDIEAAARLQGAARHLTVQVVAARPTARASSDVASPGDPSAGFSMITDLRRQTSELLHDALDEARLQQLRAEGEAMDSDQAAAYALEAISRARQLGAD
jgi:hypothetical protein